MTPTEQIDTKELRKHLCVEYADNVWADIQIGELRALLDRLERAEADNEQLRATMCADSLAKRAEAAAGAVPNGSITGDEVTALAHKLIREQLDGEDEDFHNSRAHGIGSLNGEILTFIKERAAAPSAPVAAQAEPVLWISRETLRRFTEEGNCHSSLTATLRRSEAVDGHDVPLFATPPAPMQEAGKDAVVEAARAWWAMHRPVNWTEAQHRANAEVNCLTEADQALARAIATSKEEA